MKASAPRNQQAATNPIPLLQKYTSAPKNNRGVFVTSSYAQDFALWEVESSADFEGVVPSMPTPYIVAHRKSGGHIREVVNAHEKEFTVKPHSISIIPPFTPTYVFCSGLLSMVHLTLPIDFIRRTLKTAGLSTRFDLQLNACSNNEDLIAANLMVAMIEYARLARWHALTTIAKALAIHLVEQYGSTPDHLAKKHLDENEMQMATEIMTRCLSITPNVEGIAKKLHMEIPSFSQRFKVTTGFTPLGYYRKLRLERAKDLIETSRKTLTEIAMELGFTDAAHFSKAFHKHWGFPPSVFRLERGIRLSDHTP